MFKKLNIVGFITILLILRILLLFLGAFKIIPEEISLVLFLLLTYIFTAVFIVKYLDKLEEYYITPISVILFIIAPLTGILINSTIY